MIPPPEREELLFAAALERSPSERAAFLDEACHGFPGLRQRIEALLAAHEHPNSSLPDGVATVWPTMKMELGDRPAVEAVGQTIGRYKLLEKLGEGGCGVVYVAEQTEPVRRRVALKVIKLGMDTRQVVARFEAERQALAMMDHPNIAKVLDGGTTETGRPYFVMELVRGIRITEYCDQNNLPTTERLELFIKVCHAIQHAHQKGIIHRDIKPSNILVTLHDGVPVPKVIDFGIAKAIEGRLTDATVYTQLHQFIGTPAYISPEQAEMSELDVDTRSDIYSLGVLLYELLTGKTPLDAKELMSLGIDAMRKTIREKEPLRPSTKLHTLQGEELTTTAKRRSTQALKLIHLLRGDLDWIVMKCLDKDRTRRYDTANGLAIDLKRHLNNEPVAARPPSTAYKVQKAWRRNKVAFTAAAVVALALVVGLALAVTERAQAVFERQRAEENARNAQASERKALENERIATRQKEETRWKSYASDMNLAQLALEEGNLGRARDLLDRHRPSPGEEDLRGWVWRYLWAESRGDEIVTLGVHPGSSEINAISSVAISPDGNKLASASISGSVAFWDLDQRQMLRYFPGRQGKWYDDYIPVAWLADNQSVALADKFSIRIIESSTGRISQEITNAAQTMPMAAMAVSGDGAILAYAVENHSDITLRDTATWKVIGRPFSNLSGPMSLSSDGTILAAIGTNSIEIWNVAEHRRLALRQEVSRPRYLQLSPDGTHLATSPEIGVDVELWNWQANVLQTLSGHTGRVHSAAFSADNRRLATFSEDQSIKLWDSYNGKNTGTLKGHERQVWAGAYSPDGRTIVSAGIGGAIKLWRSEPQRKAVDTFEGWMPLGVSKDGRTLITLSTNGALQQRRSDTLAEIRQLPLNIISAGRRFARPSFAGAASDASLVAVADQQSRELDIFDTQSGKPVAQVKGNGEFPWWDTVFSMDGQRLATAVSNGDGRSDKRWVQIWELPSGKPLHALTDANGPLAVSNDGRLLTTCNPQGHITIWDFVTGLPIRKLVNDPPQLYYGTGFSPDGRLLCANKLNNDVLLFDCTNGDSWRLGATKTDSGFSYYSSDGKISGVIGSSVKLFSIPARQEIATLHYLNNGGNGCLFSCEQGNVLILGAPDHWELLTKMTALRACVWRAPSWAEIHAGEAKNGAEGRRP